MRKRIILFVFGLFLMCLIILLFCYQQNNDEEQQKNDYRLMPEEIEQLQEGDIILRRGFGLISDAIVKYAHDDYPVSHCGIIVKDSLGKWAVIHTVSNTLAVVDGMQEDGLWKFVKESRYGSIIVLRFHYTCDSMAERIVQQARYYLGQQIPFDHRFDCCDSNAFFCTEFVWSVFNKAISVDIYDQNAEKGMDCMNFSAFFDSTKFSVILNHPLQYSNK
jgi:uncharacterized protein YycO